jgi:hypothetical protein
MILDLLHLMEKKIAFPALFNSSNIDFHIHAHGPVNYDKWKKARRIYQIRNFEFFEPVSI